MGNTESERMLSRRMLMAQAVVATSAVVLAACGGSSGGSGASTDISQTGNVENAGFDLVINPNRSLLVSGTLDGKPVAANGSLFSGGTAVINGSLAGLDVIAHLTQSDQIPSAGGYQTTSKLIASVGKAITNLEGVFKLDSGFGFESGDITGLNQGKNVRATTTPLPGTGVGNGAKISGNFGTTQFALSGVIPGTLPGNVVGTINSRQVHFEVTNSPPTRNANFRPLRVTGTYSGPVDLMALVLGVIAYFGA